MGIYKVVNRIKMSDAEAEEVPQVPEEEEKADNIKDALKMVIKKSAANDGLVKGLNEVCKCLDRKQAILSSWPKTAMTQSTRNSSTPSPSRLTCHSLKLNTEMISESGSATASTTLTAPPRRSREPPPLLSRTTARKLRLSPSYSTTSRKRVLATETTA